MNGILEPFSAEETSDMYMHQQTLQKIQCSLIRTVWWASDLYLWGNFKQKVYVSIPHTSRDITDWNTKCYSRNYGRWILKCV